MTPRVPIAQLVQRIHFEDFGGAEFERLVFAYHVRAGWREVEWYGQTGSDQGRDIVGECADDVGNFRRAVIQCVNRGSLTQAKAKMDIDKALSFDPSIASFKFVTRGTVSAARRNAIKAFSDKCGVNHLTIWSGADFEENLRLIGEDLLRRFCMGEAFPDGAEKLRSFADDFPSLGDEESLAQMAAVFDRPAFRTPFFRECSLHAFQQAVEDTIAALNTGLWRTREGEDIRRIPSVHHLRNPVAKRHVTRAIQLVDELRRTFVSGLRDGTIKPCGCGNPSCTIFMVEPSMGERLDRIRSDALQTFHSAWPGFAVALE
ncbi:hypothetical protein [Mesorhizobium sp. B2-7-1]|uniref:restriction endonuclease n=1 Tax=Mesorhizobium sp. B2-7-1 TaxID=2589909 RepID=UPI001FF03CE7|nr:hypothetical protein [Mesorhizobium sp. B2-7-1]